MLPTLTQKEAIWLACKAKSCCYTPAVIPTGRDVWRIARALDTPPASFLLYFPTTSARRDAFALDRSGQMFRIALGKARSRRKTAPPCIFLLRTRIGHHRCGLGDLRPLVCRAFPAGLEDGVLSLANSGQCVCHSWTLSEVDIAEETALVEARQRDAEEYCAVVARWNARIAHAPAEASAGFADFCAYLLEEYDRLAPAPSVAQPGGTMRNGQVGPS